MPVAMALNEFQNVIYIADEQNHRIRMLNRTSNIITTYVGSGNGNSGDGGQANVAQISMPFDVKYDPTKNMLYIVDPTHVRIRVVNVSSNIISTFAGSTAGYSGDGMIVANN